MKLLRKKAENIGSVQGIQEIILIINILVNIFKLWWECKKKPSEILVSIKSGKLSILEKVTLRRLVTKEFGNITLAKRKQIEVALLQEASNLTEQEILEIFKEVQK